MGMGRYQEVDLLYTQFLQGRHRTASTSVYECSLSFRGTDEDGISLTHVEECDADRFINRTKGGGTTSPSDEEERRHINGTITKYQSEHALILPCPT
jgi:hypothetical protein